MSNKNEFYGYTLTELFAIVVILTSILCIILAALKG